MEALEKKMVDRRTLEYNYYPPEGWDELRESVFHEAMERMGKSGLCERLTSSAWRTMDEDDRPLVLNAANVIDVLSSPKAERVRLNFMARAIGCRRWDRWLDPVRMFTPDISILHFVEIMISTKHCCDGDCADAIHNFSWLVASLDQDMRENEEFSGVVLNELFTAELHEQQDAMGRRRGSGSLFLFVDFARIIERVRQIQSDPSLREVFKIPERTRGEKES